MGNKGLTLLAGISSFALVVGAHAQTAPSAATPATVSERAAAASDPDIVVTGSRVVTNGNAQPTPVMVVTTEQLLSTTPTNLPDALKKLPGFARSLGVAAPGGNIDNLNGNYLNLRGLGVQRNLILLDGRRMVPTSYSGAVDTNVLPQMLVQRVDVVTGGASAVYGSDAVSGVVNFVLDKKFEGLKVDAQSGISNYGDSRSWKVGAAFGTSLFDGRGHFEASAEHFSQDGILKSDREPGRRVYALSGNGSAANPFRLLQDARANYNALKGLILSGPFAGRVVDPNGQVVPFAHGVSGGGSLESGGDGFYAKGTSATADLETTQAFGRFDFDVSDSLSIFAQGLYTESRNEQATFPLATFGVVISNTNPYLPAALRGQAQPFFFGRTFDDPNYTQINRNTTRTYAGTIGLSQKLGAMTLDVAYQHARTTSRNRSPNSINNGRFYAALDAVDRGVLAGGAPNGQIICRVTVTNPTAYPGCVPFNPFANPSTQADAVDYFLDQSNSNSPRYTLDNVDAALSGTAFDNWAGPVKIALSGEYRKLALDVASSVLPGDRADCTGILFNCSATTPRSGLAGLAPVHVDQTVKEAAAEILFPLLKDVAFAQSLDLNGAVRYTDYSTSGHVVTWKLGGDWSVDGNLRFRATRSRDIRAPSLFELYQSPTTSQSGFQDLHTGVGRNLSLVSSGNPSLVPEVANTLTVGGVWSSPGIRNLSLSVDYYRIAMRNAISSVDGRGATIQNVCETSGGTSVFCSLYERPLPFSDRTAANFPTLVRSQQLNTARIRTWGIDGEVNYAFALGDGGVSLRGLVGYQPKFTTTLAPGLPTQSSAGAASAAGGQPKWRLAGFVSYNSEHWGIDIQERWRSSLRFAEDRTLVFDIPDVPSVAYTDVTLKANIGADDKKKQIYLSVQNAFNRKAPVYSSTLAAGLPGYFYPAVSGDDIIGRYFTVGARMQF